MTETEKLQAALKDLRERLEVAETYIQEYAEGHRCIYCNAMTPDLALYACKLSDEQRCELCADAD